MHRPQSAEREYRVSIWQQRRIEAFRGSKHPRSSGLTMQPCLRVKSSMTTYQQVGGLKTFRRLARDFYARVTRDPLLQRLFSKRTDKQRERLALFLAETFGGPKRYSQQRGRRSLQEMHAAFPIGEREIQAWKKHMLAAMDTVGIEAPARSAMRGFFCGGLQQIADNSRYDVSQPELKQLLVQDRSVANARGHLGNLLHDAAQAWDIERLRLLLSFGADVNARN